MPAQRGDTISRDDLIQFVLEAVYPIGSIYISVTNTNPSILFGGTWVAFGQGKTLIGIDTNDSDFDTVEKTGGEKHHTLSTNEMPSHTHTFTGSQVTTNTTGNHSHSTSSHLVTSAVGAWNDRYARGNWEDTNWRSFSTDTKGNHSHTVTAAGTNSSNGGGEAHNNLQPYIITYMWKRTA